MRLYSQLFILPSIAVDVVTLWVDRFEPWVKAEDCSFFRETYYFCLVSCLLSVRTKKVKKRWEEREGHYLVLGGLEVLKKGIGYLWTRLSVHKKVGKPQDTSATPWRPCLEQLHLRRPFQSFYTLKWAWLWCADGIQKTTRMSCLLHLPPESLHLSFLYP